MPTRLEIRRNYDRECVKLKIWYVHRLLQTGQRRFEELITAHVDIYRRTHLWDGERHPARGHLDPKWNALVDQLKGLFERHSGDDTTKSLEEAAYALVRPAMEQRLAGERAGDLWKEAGQDIPPTPYGSFSRDYAEDRVHLHFTNVLQPKSPFWDMPGTDPSTPQTAGRPGTGPAGHSNRPMRQLDQQLPAVSLALPAGVGRKRACLRSQLYLRHLGSIHVPHRRLPLPQRGEISCHRRVSLHTRRVLGRPEQRSCARGEAPDGA